MTRNSGLRDSPADRDPHLLVLPRSETSGPEEDGAGLARSSDFLQVLLPRLTRHEVVDTSRNAWMPASRSR